MSTDENVSECKALIKPYGVDPKSMVGLPVVVDSGEFGKRCGEIVKAEAAGDYIVITMRIDDPGIQKALLDESPIGIYSIDIAP